MWQRGRANSGNMPYFSICVDYKYLENSTSSGGGETEIHFFFNFLVYLETSVFNWIWIWKLILVRLGSSSNQVGTQRSLLIRVSPNLGRLGAKDTTLPEGMPETHALGKEKECLILSGKLLEGQWFGVLGYSFQTQDLIWKRSARGHGPPMYPIHGAGD